MRSRSLLGISVLLAAFAATPGHAQEGEYIGLDVRDICEDSDSANIAFCGTLFTGIILGYQMAQDGGTEGRAVCLPDDIASSTLRDIYVSFTWDDPRMADKPFRETLPGLFTKPFFVGAFGRRAQVLAGVFVTPGLWIGIWLEGCGGEGPLGHAAPGTTVARIRCATPLRPRFGVPDRCWACGR